MNLFKTTALLFLGRLASATAQFWYGDADAPTSEELQSLYPALEEESNRTGNPLILCPFLRLLERSGRLDSSDNNNNKVDNAELKAAAEDFGCDPRTACGPVIELVSAGQRRHESGGFQSFWSIFNPFGGSHHVDLERLWDAPPVSHECGFTFEQGQGQQGVSADRLNLTMARFAARQNENGTLVYSDILETKLEICEGEGVQMSTAGETEARLIFAFLGGVERGYVEYSDVERFLQMDNQLPLTTAENQITAFYLLQVN